MGRMATPTSDRPVRIRIAAADGTRLSAERWPSGPGADPEVAVLVLPGFFRRAASAGTRELCRRLRPLGEVTALDFRGHGRSRGWYTFGRREPQDLEALLDATRRGGALRIGLVGLSMGGWIAADLLGRDPAAHPEVRCMAFIGTPDDPLTVRARPGLDLIPCISVPDLLLPPRLRRRALRGPRPTAAERLSQVPLPVAILHHRRDWLVGFDHAERLARSGGGPRLLFPIDGGGRYHADSLVHRLPHALFPPLLAFLRAHLATAG
jgi:pimeloyl-ACP methyl ester carboxylesterase